MLTPFRIRVEIGFQKIGEKEYPEDDKHDEEFDKNNNPNLSTPFAHISETIEIEAKYSFKP